MKKVITYLAIKYGITLFEMDYTDSKGNILWNYKENKAYNNSVAGIGYDSLLGVFQKQAAGTGGTDELKIACNKLYIANSENPSVINDGDIVIWGHNGQCLNDIDDDTFSVDRIHYLSKRIWKIQFNGNTSRQLPLKIILDGSKIDSAGTIVLAVSQGKVASFDIDSTELYYPDSIDTNNLYYYSNISWDNDSTGFDYFTFQVLQETLLFSLRPDGTSENRNNDSQDNIEDKIKFNVFPNPASDAFTVEIYFPDTLKARITISDLNGKVIAEKELNICGNYTCQQSLKESGCYVVTLEAASVRRSQRIVIKK